MTLLSSDYGFDVFWGELAPCDHLVQIYDDESRFMQTLERFIGEGLHNGEATIAIATAATTVASIAAATSTDVITAAVDGSVGRIPSTTRTSRSPAPHAAAAPMTTPTAIIEARCKN